MKNNANTGFERLLVITLPNRGGVRKVVVPNAVREKLPDYILPEL